MLSPSSWSSFTRIPTSMLNGMCRNTRRICGRDIGLSARLDYAFRTTALTGPDPTGMRVKSAADFWRLTRFGPISSTAMSPDRRFSTRAYWLSGVIVTKAGSAPTDATAITRRVVMLKMVMSPLGGFVTNKYPGFPSDAAIAAGARPASTVSATCGV